MASVATVVNPELTLTCEVFPRDGGFIARIGTFWGWGKDKETAIRALGIDVCYSGGANPLFYPKLKPGEVHVNGAIRDAT